MTIAENIRRIRRAAGMTQDEFGRLAGVSSMAVSQWENGRAIPRMGAVEKISLALRIAKSELIADDDVPDNAIIAARNHDRFSSESLSVKAASLAKVPLAGSTPASGTFPKSSTSSQRCSCRNFCLIATRKVMP